MQVLPDASYLDWNGAFDILDKAYDASLFVLIIGPKGTGKTTLVRDFARRRSMSLRSVNFSLRTRESHLVGAKTMESGTITFDEGILIRSMKEGSMLYLDELNAAEADVLLRLDEALDDRRQIVLKESAGDTITARQGWFVIGTINPLTHVGTKELPPQLLSRFPVRIRLDYPPEETEMQIVQKYVSGGSIEDLKHGIRLANTLRQAAAVEELDYSPSIRETISYGKMLEPRRPAKRCRNHRIWKRICAVGKRRIPESERRHNVHVWKMRGIKCSLAATL